jgi:MoxR-like ATPase
LIKEEIKNQIIFAVRNILKKRPELTDIDVSLVLTEAGWDKDTKKEILRECGVDKMTGLIALIPELVTYTKKNPAPVYIKFQDSTVINSESLQEKETATEETCICLHDRIESLLRYINSGLKEKEEAVRLALLASIAGESVFFLGPPGTAKSMISRRLRCAFKGEKNKELIYFEYLMNQFSTPDEVFGPVSLKALEDNRYERITDGYLPSADVAFLDEIWKAGPAIQNTLLTILNEKKFHNGNQVLEVPLKVLISASNELPAEEQGLEALWDRFLIRMIVNPIEDEDAFMELVCGGQVAAQLHPTDSMARNLISVDELTTWKQQTAEIEVPDDVCSVITAVRQEMTLRNNDKKREEKFYVSDRRWKKIVHILKTSAFLNGRAAVDVMDCQLIEYCIWNTDSQIAEAKEIVKKCIAENGLAVDTAVEDIKAQIKVFDTDITDRFYVASAPAPKIYKMSDETTAYKLLNPKQIQSYNYCTPYYIAPEYDHENYDRTGAYFDNEGNLIGDYDYYIKDGSFTVNGNTANWTDGCGGQHYSFEIEMTAGGYKKNPGLFGKGQEENLRVVAKDVDENKYAPILRTINDELQQVETYCTSKSAPFKANLFAEQTMCDVILTAVEKSRLELEKAKTDLDNARKRYSV